METKHPFYVAKEIRAQLAKSKEKIIKGNQDRVFVIDGREGSGKSTLAIQLAYTIDPTLSLDDICFDGDSLMKRIRYLAEKNIKHKAIIFDEAFAGLSSKGALTKINRELVKLLMEVRQLNLFIFIVLPSIFLLERYVAIFRSHALLHTSMSKKDVKNRFYWIYNYQKKKTLYLLGKQMMSYSRPRIIQKFRFYGNYPPTISQKVYEEKKLSAFHENKNDEEAQVPKYKVQRDDCIRFLWEHSLLNKKQISELFKDKKFPLSKTSITDICKDVPKKRKNEET